MCWHNKDGVHRRGKPEAQEHRTTATGDERRRQASGSIRRRSAAAHSLRDHPARVHSRRAASPPSWPSVGGRRGVGFQEFGRDSGGMEWEPVGEGCMRLRSGVGRRVVISAFHFGHRNPTPGFCHRNPVLYRGAFLQTLVHQSHCSARGQLLHVTAW